MEKIKTMTKKAVVLLLTLSMLLTLAPATMAASKSLPAVGDKVHGFTVIEVKEFEELNTSIVLFEHDKSGAKVMYFPTEDTELQYALAFQTDAVDDTGIPHVFEHSTLMGSDKWPEDIFFNVSAQTYNTFMNAFTSQWFTMYPVASLSEAQLLKLADYYTDACLNPTILRDERLFRQEGWRYRMNSASDPLTYEGTVYSEMLTAHDIASEATRDWVRTAFPGSCAGNVSGGDPAHIPEMTWDALKEFHATYYHPSNCMGILYGNFKNYESFMELMDGYFSKYDKKDFTMHAADAGVKAITSPQVASYAYPASASASTANGSYIYYNFICPGASEEEIQLLNTITDILNFRGSVLYRNVNKVLPGASIYCYFDDSVPEPTIIVRASSVNKNDGAKLKQAVDSAIAEVAANGFDADFVKDVMNTSAIDSALIGEELAVYGGVAYYIVRSYMDGGNYWGYLDYLDTMKNMETLNSQGAYKQIANKYLKDSQTTVLVTTYPEPGLKEKNEAALRDKLASIKASMSQSEINEIVAASNTVYEKDPKQVAEMIKGLQAVTIRELPEKLREYTVTDRTSGGVRHIDVGANTGDVGYVCIKLDASGIAQEDLHWLKLYADMIAEFPTTKHDADEVDRLFATHCHDGNTALTITPDYSTNTLMPHPYFDLFFYSTADDLANGYDVMREVLLDAVFDDADAMLASVQLHRYIYAYNTTNSPMGMFQMRSLGRGFGYYKFLDYVSYLPYYLFLGEVEEMLKTNPKEVGDNLVRVRDQLNNSKDAIAICCGGGRFIDANSRASNAFLRSLNSQPIKKAEYSYGSIDRAAASEAFVVDAGSNFNYLGAYMENHDNDAAGVMMEAASDKVATPILREQNGAYGGYAYGWDDGSWMCFYGYRDPNVAQTYELMHGLLVDKIEAMDVTQEEMNGYILGIYSSYAKPEGELAGAVSEADWAVRKNGISYADYIQRYYLQPLKKVTLDAVKSTASYYRDMLNSENLYFATAGAYEVLKENEALYEIIYDPFGLLVVDTTPAPAPQPEPEPEPQPVAPPQVQLTNQALSVNGELKTAEIYNIDGSNYFKLRDIAMLLNGTASQFSVEFDAARNTIVIKTGEAYTAVGGELEIGADKSATAVASAQSIEINGEMVDSLTAYNLAGNNFFKLRDLGNALGFNVDYDEATRTMLVTSK